LLDLNFNTSLKPKQGRLLIAEPFANDDYFRRSVVLVCDHSDKGSFGFVLNNYLDLDFNDLSEEKLSINTRVSVGGPVDIKNLYYLHSFPNEVPDCFKINEKLALGGDYKTLMKLLKGKKNPEKYARFFLGYSGWTELQLDKEIEDKSWIVTDPELDMSLLDTSSSDLWYKCLNSLGGKYKLFAQFPINPSNN
jgi:putative transcriptional regulator